MAAEQNGVSPAPPQESSTPRLELEKLHALPSEQQELYLLSFTSDLVKHVSSLDSEEATTQQAAIKKQLLDIVNLPAPVPTRITRNNLGTSFGELFARCNRKLLFESINDLVAIVSAGKEKDIRAKHAAVVCLGSVMETAGDSAISHTATVFASLLRLLKSASNNTGLRAAVYTAIGRTVKGIGASMDEASAKEIWKAARSAVSSDKAYHVQIQATWCLEQLVTKTAYFSNLNDFEKLQNAVWKASECPCQKVRIAVARLLASALTKAFSELPGMEATVVRKPKRTKAKALDDDAEEVDDRPSPISPRPPTELSLTLIEILQVLSPRYLKAGSNRTRATIAMCYRYVFESLGERIVESRYPDIVRHFFVDVLDQIAVKLTRYRVLLTRKLVRIVLEDVVHQMLGQSAQLNAARFLLNDVLKDYPPALKERPVPPKAALISALSALEDLLDRLSLAIQPLAETCRETLLQVLQHPSYSVQIYIARCLKALVTASPSQLLSTITLCMNSVGREIQQLATQRQSPRRCVGFANGLAALLCASAQNPLYGSIDVYARVLELATNLLKSSGSSNVKISAVQVQVAWIMIGGLMSLGPSFVKIHLPQLLLLWRNALPLPPSKDEIQKRSMIEQSFLTHVRECALGSIIAFLRHNSRLITSDVAKRLAAMLQSTTQFLAYLPAKKFTDDPASRLWIALQLHDFDIMVRRRVFQCFTLLVTSNAAGVADIVQESNIVSISVTSFADPDNLMPTTLSASIASSIGAFDTIWDAGDNSGFGVTGLVRADGYDTFKIERQQSSTSQRLRISDPDSLIERTVRTPFGEAWEHDGIANYLPDYTHNTQEPRPPATELINAAITAFALAFPLQSPRVQASILEQLLAYLSPATKEPARKTAITVNISTTLLLVTKVLRGQTYGPSGKFQSSGAEKIMQRILHTLIVDDSEIVRAMAADALGRFSNIAGSDFTNSEVDTMVNMIVSQREPSSRAGCALALSAIHGQLGGMAANYHLKTIVGLLMSLAADQHPTVHYWALESLARVSDLTAGLTFSSYVSGCIGLLSQLYIFDSHNTDAAAEASSNLEVERNTVANITRCVNAIINVLGPGLQDMTKSREMILTLMRQLESEDDVVVLAESARCMQNLAMYAPGHMQFEQYVKSLQANLSSTDPAMREVTATSISNLMRKDAPGIIATADPGLEEKLWELLDEQPDWLTIRNIFENWLQQTGLSDCHDWVRRCNAILTKARAKLEDKPKDTKIKAPVLPDIQDEEVAGFAAAAGTKEEDVTAPASAQELPRWQVRLFAMDLLTELITIVTKEAASDDESPAKASFQAEVADVVKIAFSASTAGVVELRIRGLGILDKILKMFGSTPDPDFVDAMLLEQCQAQISSALTPAFAADSSPELAAQAVNVCATFISIGIVTDVEKMGRIHKLLVSALDSFAERSEAAAIGDLKGLSANSQVMVRMAVFSAWADLQIAAGEQKYLEEVVKPHLARLTPLWLSSLREYARLRFEPDGSSSSSSALTAQSPDALYAALGRETLLKFYQDTWLKFVDAIASLIDEDTAFVFDALDGKSDEKTINGVNGDKHELINYREEPTAFFFVLFGLAFEALAARFDDGDSLARSRRLDILQALKKILRPSVAGTAIYQDVIFSETMDLFDRMILTEGTDVQTTIVEIARNMCIVHPASRKPEDAEDESISDDIDQLFELTRIIVLVLAGLVPGLAESNRPTRAHISDEGVILVRLALESLVDAAQVFPSVIKSDLHACILHLFVTILGTGTCQQAVVPTAVPIFRRFLDDIATPASGSAINPETAKQIRNTFGRMLIVLGNAQKRENEASLACEKNTLLAGTILLTTAHAAFSKSDRPAARFMLEVSHALANPATTKMAAGCARSLLLLLPPTSSLRALACSLLLPRLALFLAAPAPSDMPELEETVALLAASLTTFAATTTVEAARGSAYAVVMAALLARHNAAAAAAAAVDDPARGSGGADTGRRLLELAGVDAVAFRGAVLRLDGEGKALMEKVLRESGSGGGGGAGESRGAQGGREGDGREAGGAHSIALRMDF